MAVPVRTKYETIENDTDTQFRQGRIVGSVPATDSICSDVAHRSRVIQVLRSLSKAVQLHRHGPMFW